MDSLLCRALQVFVTDTYGAEAWGEALAAGGVQSTEFELLLRYPASTVSAVRQGVGRALGKPLTDVMEDLGTFLVADQNMRPLRRLLRFGGADFQSFLETFDELPERIAFALDGAVLPTLSVVATSEAGYEIRSSDGRAETLALLVGILRAMADDYGALAYVEVTDPPERGPARDAPGHVRISLLSSSFAEGRSFSLSRKSRA